MSQALQAFIKRPACAKIQYSNYIGLAIDHLPGDIAEPTTPDDMIHAFGDHSDLPVHDLSAPMLRSRNRTALARNWSGQMIGILEQAPIGYRSVRTNMADAVDEVD